MTSTVTLVDTEPTEVGRESSGVFEYELSLDGVSGAQLVRTPSVGSNRVWVVAMLVSESSAGNLVLKSGSPASKTKTLELAANQGIYDKVNGGYVFSTKSGEALYVDSSMAVSSLTIKVIESAIFRC